MHRESQSHSELAPNVWFINDSRRQNVIGLLSVKYPHTFLPTDDSNNFVTQSHIKSTPPLMCVHVIIPQFIWQFAIHYSDNARERTLSLSQRFMWSKMDMLALIPMTVRLMKHMKPYLYGKEDTNKGRNRGRRKHTQKNNEKRNWRYRKKATDNNFYDVRK